MRARRSIGVVPSCPLLIDPEPHRMRCRFVAVRRRECGPARTSPLASICWGRVGGCPVGSDGEAWMAPPEGQARPEAAKRGGWSVLARRVLLVDDHPVFRTG